MRFNRIMNFAYNTCAAAAIFVRIGVVGAKGGFHMPGSNWTVRIIVFLGVVIVFGVLVGSYYENNKPPPRQHITQMVPNDRLP